MTTLADRLKHGRIAAGLSQEALAAECGVSQTTVSKIERGESEETRKAHLLAAACGVSTTWLITGRGPEKAPKMQLREADAPGYDLFAIDETPAGYIRLPQLDVEASAGDGMLNDSGLDVVRYLDVAEEWAQRNLPRDLERVRVMSARGDSMAPDILDGDVLFVDTAQDRFVGDGIYVFHWHGLLLVKRLAPQMARGTIAILSSNTSRAPEEITTSELDQLHVVGRVAAWWTLRKH